MNVSRPRARIPYPPLVSARWAGVIAVAWPSALLDTTRLALAGSASAVEVAEQAILVGLRVATGAYAFAAGSRGSAVRRLGTSTALLTLVGAWRWHHNAPIWPGALVGTLLSSIVVAFAGAAILVWFLWPKIERPSLEADDRALVTAALYIAIPAAVLDIGAAGILSRFGHSAASWALFFAAWSIALPIALAALAKLRIHHRHRWLAKVAGGQDPQWRIVAAQHLGAESLPRIQSGYEEGSILVHVHESKNAPFRGGQHLEPVAFVGADAEFR